MRRLGVAVLLGCCITMLLGCAVLRRITHPFRGGINNTQKTPLASYSGPKARIAIADFDVKAVNAEDGIGSGLQGMLAKALSNSGRFNIVERYTLNAALPQQELSVSGGSHGSQPEGQEKSKIKTADLIVTAAVLEFEPGASGGKAGIGGGGGGGSGILGGLLGTVVNKAHMTLDVRVVDASTSKVLAATLFHGEASDISGSVMEGFLDNWGLTGELSLYANTPMEKAIRICIVDAVRYISQAIPADYYKYY